MCNHKDYKLNDRVKFVKVNGDWLEEKTGTVVGLAIDNVIRHYIIEVDDLPKPNWNWKCVIIPEVCIERI